MNKSKLKRALILGCALFLGTGPEGYVSAAGDITYEEGFVVDPSPHRQDVAGLEIRERRHDGFHRIAALQFEDFGAVEKSHVDAARLGRIVVHDTIIGWRQVGRRHDILEHGAVFDLRHADHGRIDLVGSRKVEQYPFGVAQLAVVLGRVPLFGPFGGELVVEHLGVVDRIEEILQVVEHHLVGLLREARHNECRQQQGEYQSFFHPRAKKARLPQWVTGPQPFVYGINGNKLRQKDSK